MCVCWTGVREVSQPCWVKLGTARPWETVTTGKQGLPTVCGRHEERIYMEIQNHWGEEVVGLCPGRDFMT